jgi:hypothetical protein
MLLIPVQQENNNSGRADRLRVHALQHLINTQAKFQLT